VSVPLFRALLERCLTPSKVRIQKQFISDLNLFCKRDNARN
jgi:hypothetical protein